VSSSVAMVAGENNNPEFAVAPEQLSQSKEQFTSK